MKNKRHSNRISLVQFYYQGNVSYNWTRRSHQSIVNYSTYSILKERSRGLFLNLNDGNETGYSRLNSDFSSSSHIFVD